LSALLMKGHIFICSMVSLQTSWVKSRIPGKKMQTEPWANDTRTEDSIPD
jgi:hypothetical protein